jgi:hypothetical protein
MPDFLHIKKCRFMEHHGKPLVPSRLGRILVASNCPSTIERELAIRGGGKIQVIVNEALVSR